MLDKSINVKVLRVTAMCFILFCHLANQSTNIIKQTSHFFDCGIYIFFFISAFLYSKKEITNKKNWFLKKIIQLDVPIFIWLIVVNLIYLFINNTVSLKHNLIYILNLQAFIFDRPVGLGHLWYITITLLFYILNITLLNNKEIKNINKIVILFLMFSLGVGISFIFEKIGLYVIYMFIYILMFWHFKQNIHIKNWKNILIFIAGVILRIISMILLDNTIIYGNILVPLTQTMIAFSITNYVLNFNFDFLINNIVINKLDSLTYYVYIVHYIFCVGPIRVYDYINNYYLSSIIIIILSLIFGFLLMNISKIIIKLINIKNNRKVNKNEQN